ncbi:hypothetical protein BC830DRAFT_378114 [Chytriomyces sp. MP71]|nr:hypothetical protein BC830DRAFT_378114 [Chytriomyces sp. MP71]
MNRLPQELVAEIVKWLKRRDLFVLVRVSRQTSFHAAEALWTRPQLVSRAQLACFLRAASGVRVGVGAVEGIIDGVGEREVGVQPEPADSALARRSANTPNEPTRVLTFAYAKMIRKMSLQDYNKRQPLLDSEFTALLRCAPENVEKLSLGSCAALTSSSLQLIHVHCPRIQSLDLSNLLNALDSAALATISEFLGPTLTSLNLSHNPNLTTQDVEVLAFNCRNSMLKRLWIDGCFQIHDPAIEAIVKHCSHLTELYMSGLRSLTSKAIASILGVAGFQATTNNHSPYFSDYTAPESRHLRHLKDLNLSSCLNISAGVVVNLANTNTKIDSFRSITLSQIPQLDSLTVHRLVSTSPFLKNLTLTHCPSLTDMAMEAVSTLGKTLQFLHLGNCMSLTDTGIILIAKTCVKLKFLDLANLSITDASTDHISKHLTRLRRLSVVKCRNLTPLTLYHFHRIAPSLQRLHLSYCFQFTLPPLIGLMERAVDLAYLTLTGCTAILSSCESLVSTWSKAAPDAFTEAQRAVFCVLSGSGLLEFRRFVWALRQYDGATAAGGGGSGGGGVGRDEGAVFCGVTGDEVIGGGGFKEVWGAIGDSQPSALVMEDLERCWRVTQEIPLAAESNHSPFRSTSSGASSTGTTSS